MVPADWRETFIRFVPADVWARAQGYAGVGEDISGFFLLKRQGDHMVLWEVLNFVDGVAQTLRPIGPIDNADYGPLLQRNFGCS
jgi:hypothetical protein